MTERQYLTEFIKYRIVKRWHHTNSTAIMSYISNTPPNPRSAGTLIRRLPSFSQAERMRAQHSLNL